MNASVLEARLDALPGTEVLAKEELIRNDIRLFERVFSPPIRLMSGIALLVGTLVVGLVIYTATVERRREYGVLKALGAPGTLLYRVVGIQAMTIAGAGSLLGIGLTVVVARLITQLRPQFLIVLAPGSVVLALASGALMALAAALLPARVLARLAPAEVFRR
jgi:putative ABC transport system permease protein